MANKNQLRFILGSLGTLAACAGTAIAQEDVVVGASEKSVRIVRASSAPTIDGVLDEAVWQDAAVIEDLHEIQPNEYTEPSEPTTIYLLYDDDALYVGARLYDAEPERITNRILRQGERVFGDDWFSVIIDPFNDHRSGYRFLTNPNGLRQEGLYQNVSDEQWNWQGIWYADASINEEGWVAEIAIPYKSISFDPNNDTWGINFRRALARRDERMGWVSRNRNTDPSTSGDAVGFEGLDQGLGLDVVPSISYSQDKQFATPGTPVTTSVSGSDADPSLDLFYKITSGVTASLTANTDFSATEIDDREVNLSRFSLFFPEKRDFFLQDADIFEFGGIDENGRPFFSRTIGLSSTGEPVDLDVGGKLSGRLGPFNFGALAVRQDGFGEIAPDNAIAARGSANLLAESSVGFIATEGNPRSNRDNSLAGFDFQYRNTQLPGGKTMRANVWFQQSDTEGIDGDEDAYGFGIASPNSTGWRGGVRFKRLGGDFNPGLGFVNRAGIEFGRGLLRHRWRPTSGFLRSIDTGVEVEQVESLETGVVESEQINMTLLELEARQGDEFELDHRRNTEVLPVDFEISEGVVIPMGEYDFNRSSFEVSTGDQRRVSGSFEYTGGGFYDGDRDEYELGFTWRPSGRFRAHLSYELNEIDLPAGSFDTRLSQFRTDVAFSSTLSWVTLIQYDNVSEVIGLNSRLHWIPQAGREAWLVFNNSFQDFDRDNGFESFRSDASVKFTYTLRY